MKFFFIKSILLITLVFILGITIRSFLPYMVSAPLNYVKHKTFEDKKDKLDILFLGSFHVLRIFQSLFLYFLYLE